MNMEDFLKKHYATAAQIPAAQCLQALLEELRLGLEGQGRLPMLLSYLSADIALRSGDCCCVLDAGGTNLRTALAVLGPDGTWQLQQLRSQPMPGTREELSHHALYEALAAPVKELGRCEKVGFCFSYNVTLGRNLDGTLDFWCKEVRSPEAVGKPVGASLRQALGSNCQSVHVLNDSVAAMLGAGTPGDPVQVGIILGTGINVCYLERCENIRKLPEALPGSMIISTEVGEFHRIPQSDFERAVIAATDAPGSAPGEKQCAGGYLGDIIRCAWRAAADEGILPPYFSDWSGNLSDISRALSGESVPVLSNCPEALDMAGHLIRRAARVAAILCAGPMIFAARSGKHLRAAVEGSQYWKLTGFREAFHRELDSLLKPWGITYEILRSENACLIGAACAAFATPM